MSKTQWAHGFYRLTPEQRRQILADQYYLSSTEQSLLAEQASKLGNNLVENYITDYSLPEGVVTGLVVNGKSYTLPLVVEEPSVIAAANNGARRIAKSGGFYAETSSRALVGQVVIDQGEDPVKKINWLKKNETTFLEIANAAHPSMKKRGGGAKKVRIRQVGRFISIDLLIDVCQAMGANTVNTMAEAVAHYLTENGINVVTAILSNYATDSLQTVTCKVAYRDLATKQMDGAEVARRIVDLSELAQVDPYRATTHNKGIMNGIDAAMIASGNDWRAIESGAHAYASRNGQYRGLSIWKIIDNQLEGSITLPMPVGVIGGSIGLNSLTKLNYHLNGIETAQELAAVITSLGLAQNFAAIRALATTGIQAGHMKLQYRSLAISVGAKQTEVEQLVTKLSQQSHVDQEVAKRLLATIRKESSNE
ncbi:hydroxymethylglutaryl-CoA reductase, degradative [Limosilactobacillus fastidiosus]|uniref:3-hydroxy-3-methylglutaryl coenzyme A reductase n=1 Tax=Limosilactobacillus fastidiosus TaxID=2759855 RepID=A0A7W3YCY6_9LACO|nr:hydroxymethylglutaryl-CoA reductase, degradative [Limosilactobacillus fastidiosus]MBB1062646.1 hydroxymethylglutaryl-CoA reductase, degradative [Limosilactobacillus fastidiosus]MBB1086611.1 hydroxymethylglutaryl-CoA reductase, degradative [Limosilactobacillus fastidiosus]MCD7084447.1 hydroxymethylglutaryl-CoA reductase, degradative [Limosilactobacillus fastidiosus]MCD7086586.1 hydroxymethylglutaryl-CoA reductase, degradative [Limosilactobacillus fastidiosus]MCD7115294.1 hydroxymethylglutary